MSGAEKVCHRRGVNSADRHAAILEAVTKKLGEASQATIHYADLRDPTTLEPAPAELAGPTLLAIALLFQKDPDGRGAEVRLIDNRVLEVDPA